MLEDPYNFAPQPASRFWGWTAFAWLIVVGLFVGGIAYCSAANAVQLDAEGCANYAIWSRDVVLMRDVGADKEKIRAMLEKGKDDVPFFALVIVNLDQLWASTASYGEIATYVYRDCITRRGNFGTNI